jgi:hypothetical protein
VTTAADPIAAHLAELARSVRGPGRARRSVLREVHDGLDDAADAYRRAGVDADRAARLAVRDFGPVAEVAPLYQDELAAAEGKRTAVLLAVGVPVVVLSWSLLWMSGVAAGPPAPAAVGALSVVQDVGAGLATAVALVLLGLSYRRTAAPRPVAAAAAVVAIATVAVCGGTAVAMNLVQAPQAWTRITQHPLSLLVYLGSVVMVVLLNRSAARTLCTLRAPRPG